MRRVCISLSLIVWAASLALAQDGPPKPTTAGDEHVFKLFSGGEIRGKFVNVDQRPHPHYVVETPAGGRITLEKGEVQEVVRKPAREVEYDRIWATYPDSVQGQMELAEWCDKNYLSKHRKKHLERVIQLDPEHEEARRLLGFRKIKDKWFTHEEYMQNVVGKVYVAGLGWVLPQEVQLKEERRLREEKEKAGFREISRLRNLWDKPDRRRQAEEDLLKIRDPYVVKAISFYKEPKREKNPTVRVLLVRVLKNIASPGAFDVLFDTALYDPSEEVRFEAIEALSDKKPQPIIRRIIEELGDGSNEIINRAAYALYYMDDKSAIGPLIDALISTHISVRRTGGGTTATFTPNGTFGQGMRSGVRTETIKKTYRNAEVLNTLRKLAGVNFDYNVDQWKAWHATQKRTQPQDVRRD
jgi:hypothetical protein